MVKTQTVSTVGRQWPLSLSIRFSKATKTPPNSGTHGIAHMLATGRHCMTISCTITPAAGYFYVQMAIAPNERTVRKLKMCRKKICGTFAVQNFKKEDYLFLQGILKKSSKKV